jgi:hypothetical protein
MVRTATRFPAAVGVNVTFTVQLPLEAARFAPTHPASFVNSAALVPVISNVVMDWAIEVPFVTEIPVAALDVPTPCAGNVTELGFTVNRSVPVTVSGTLCGDPGALSVTVTVPFSGPVAFGVAVTLIVQEAPTVNVLGDRGQLSLAIAKLVGLVPPMAMDVIVMSPAPLLVNFRGCDVLVVFTASEPKFREAWSNEACAELVVRSASQIPRP